KFMVYVVFSSRESGSDISMLLRLTRGLRGCSRSGDTLISLNGLESLINSSNSIVIFSAPKLRVRFGGVSSTIVGGIESLGPPCGCWILAHCQVSEKRIEKNSKIAHFVFEVIFRRFERFFVPDILSIVFLKKVP